MYSLRHFSLPHHRLRKKDFLYFALFFRTLVFVSFFTFIPAVMYESSRFLGEKFAFLVVLSFFFLYAVFNILMIPLVTFFYRYWGIRVGLVLSLILTLVLFYLLDQKLYFLGGYVYGILSTFWWGSYYTIFLLYQRENKLGKGIGKIEMLVILAGSFSHFISGFLLDENPELFFIYLSLLAAVALVLIFKTSNRRINLKVTLRDILVLCRKHKKEFIGFVGAGAEGIIFSVFWPLFLFLFFRDYILLGVFATVVSLGAGIINFYLGRFIDKHDKDDGKIEELGASFFVFSWIGKFLFQNVYSFAFFDIIHYLFKPMFVLPLTHVAFRQAKKEGILSYVLFREFSYKFGSILSILLLFILIMFDLSFETIFVFAAIFSLLPLFLWSKSFSQG